MVSFFCFMMKVQIGNISIGGDCEVLIQTMTNTDTNNIELTVAQCIETIKKGAKLVRITAQTEKEAFKFCQKKIEERLLYHFSKRNTYKQLTELYYESNKTAIKSQKYLIMDGSAIRKNYAEKMEGIATIYNTITYLYGKSG